jgi:hypothetical protein
MTWGRADKPGTAAENQPQALIDKSSGGTPGIWDYVYFANKVCPGVAKVSLELGADIDKRRKKGQKKSKAIDCGAKPAEVTIELTLRPSEQAAFTKFVPMLFSLAKNSAQNPIPISHPSIEIWGLDLFVVQSLSQPHPSGGLLKITIKATEWSPEPKEISSKQKVIGKEDTTTNFLANPTAPTTKNVVDGMFNPLR